MISLKFPVEVVQEVPHELVSVLLLVAPGGNTTCKGKRFKVILIQMEMFVAQNSTNTIS